MCDRKEGKGGDSEKRMATADLNDGKHIPLYSHATVVPQYLGYRSSCHLAWTSVGALHRMPRYVGERTRVHILYTMYM